MKQVILQNEERMTSIEIAEVTGKSHNDVLKAIRKMELAWEKVQGGKFSLLQRTYQTNNGGTKTAPYYSLTKTECLYIATKFNDEARAKLVLRWEELEKERLATMVGSTRGCELSLGDLQRLAAKAEYCDEVLLSVDCMTTTQVATELSMTAQELYRWLLALGIAFWRRGRYMLYADYARMGLARSRTYLRRTKLGTTRTETYLVWTQHGRKFLHEVFSYKNVFDHGLLETCRRPTDQREVMTRI